MLTLLFIVIALAVIFDFINGFHDAANSIATVVSTKVLSPFQAVLWAAFFNVIAYLFFELSVADTVSKTVYANHITLPVILSGLIGAIFWNLLTWYLGIPSSSSHTLIGGFAGAAISHAGFHEVVKWDTVYPVLLFIFGAPLIGMLISYIISAILLWLCRKGKPHTLEGWFKRFQLVSSALFSLGHGGNDAQKVMGIILASFIAVASVRGGKVADPTVNPAYAYDSTGKLKSVTYHVTDSSIVSDSLDNMPQWIVDFNREYQSAVVTHKYKKEEYKKRKEAYAFAMAADPSLPKYSEKEPKLSLTKSLPKWVPFLCYFAIGFGTLFGGWKIVKTMGSKITKVTPFEGVAAETAGALTLFGVGWLGIPVSSTHTITGSIIGVGLTKRISAVRWGVTINLLWAWVLTIPVSALVAAGVFQIVNAIIGNPK